MAIESDHINLANRNHQLLLDLLAVGKYPDWAVTVSFYKAVHVVEAVFASDLHRHSVSHTDRENTLKIPKYKNIFRDYSHLLTASRIARYLECEGPGKFKTFTDFMTLEDVRLLVRKRLYGIEQNSLGFLSDHGKSLLKVEPAGLS